MNSAASGLSKEPASGRPRSALSVVCARAVLAQVVLPLHGFQVLPEQHGAEVMQAVSSIAAALCAAPSGSFPQAKGPWLRTRPRGFPGENNLPVRRPARECRIRPWRSWRP